MIKTSLSALLFVAVMAQASAEDVQASLSASDIVGHWNCTTKTRPGKAEVATSYDFLAGGIGIMRRTETGVTNAGRTKISYMAEFKFAFIGNTLDRYDASVHNLDVVLNNRAVPPSPETAKSVNALVSTIQTYDMVTTLKDPDTLTFKVPGSPLETCKREDTP